MCETVSVIIPAYNVGAYLGECLDSIFDGIYQDFHIFVCDDGSSDDTLDVARAYQERCGKMTVVSNERNRGLPYARNRLIGIAEGKYLAFCDGDDLMTPGRLQEQVEFLDAHEDVGAVGAQLCKFTDDPGSAVVLAPRPLTDADIKIYLAFSTSICVGASTVRHEALRTSGVRFDESYISAEDYDFFSRLGSHVRLANINTPLAFIRVHAASMSQSAPDHLIAYHVKAAKQYLRTRFNIDAQDDVINILSRPQQYSPREVTVDQSRRLLDLIVGLLNTDLVRSGAVTDETKRYIARRLLTYFTHIPPDHLAMMGIRPADGARGGRGSATITGIIKWYIYRALEVTRVWRLRGLRNLIWKHHYHPRGTNK